VNQDIFVDGVGNINVTGNIVRIDLVALQPQLKGENGEPVFASTQRIVMPLEGFMSAVELQQNIIQQLIQNGVLTVNQAAAAQTAAAEE
jgi:hypothetical protein